MFLTFALAFACKRDMQPVMRVFPPPGSTLPANGRPVLFPIAEDHFIDLTWWALGRSWGYTLGPSALVPANLTGDPREARVWTFAPLAAGTYTVTLARPFDEAAMRTALKSQRISLPDLDSFEPFLAMLPTWTVGAQADTEAPRWGGTDTIVRYDPACPNLGDGPGWVVSAHVSEDVWVRIDAGGRSDVSIASHRDGVARFLVRDTTGPVDLYAVDSAGNESAPLQFQVIPGTYGVGPKLVPR